MTGGFFGAAFLAADFCGAGFWAAFCFGAVFFGAAVFAAAFLTVFLVVFLAAAFFPAGFLAGAFFVTSVVLRSGDAPLGALLRGTMYHAPVAIANWVRIAVALISLRRPSMMAKRDFSVR